MNVITKHVQELSQPEYRACYLANYGYDGHMQPELALLRADPDTEGYAVMAWNGPVDKVKNLYGWALVSSLSNQFYEYSQYAREHCKYSFEFWVKQQHRKQGIGKMLFEACSVFDDHPLLYPHDKASSSFYKNKDYTTTYDMVKYKNSWKK